MTKHKINRVNSIDLPSLEPYRTLKRPLEHHKAGFFVAEGEKVVRRLFESNLRIRSVLLTETWFRAYSDLIESRKEAIEIYLAEKEQMESIVGFPLHKGIMALADIPKEETVERIIARAPLPNLFVAVDGIMNSENLGVIVRNCASLGVQALLVAETSCDPYLRRAVRNSMGNIFSLAIVRSANIVEDLENLRSRFGMSIIAAHPRDENRSIEKIDFTHGCCIVFGSEGEGISRRVLEVCDHFVTIPMAHGVDSLNVASASAVVLYEVQRQRSHLRPRSSASRQ
ncbi:MAG TPA: RNA methyltransferase [Bacteroidota bacterium]|nr:RNA methyltransferase [Bacteroidota bacterium]